MKQRLKWLPAIAWMLIIFLFSSQPGGGSGALSRLIMEYLAQIGIDFQAWFGEHAVWVIRKIAHFSIYFILFSLLQWPLRTIRPWPKAGWLALFGTFLYACSDEFHQLFVPGRVGDLLDVLIDSSGGLAAFLLLAAYYRLKGKHLPQRG
jgi:VanZ family protein